MTAPIRILVVDDSLTIRAMLETVFAREAGIKVVGIASNAQEAEQMVDAFRPSVVTVDIAMPGVDGLALLDRLVADGQTHVVMLSSHTEAASESLDRGAVGFFDKRRILSDAKGLVKLIRRAAAGRVARAPILS
jgi:chemotaxis response regulator CheB